MADTIRGIEWHLERTQDTTLHLEGFLSWPWRAGFPGEHGWLIQLLQEIVTRNELLLSLQTKFAITEPLWFGFWIRSPLNKLQCSVLHDLLTEMGDEIREILIADFEQKHRENQDTFPATELLRYKQIFDEDHRNLLEFLAALDVAIDNDIPVHVTLAPSGHADLGFLTTFPHCSRCKANPPMGKLDEKEIICPVCGDTYSPMKTMSMVEDPTMKELENLESEDE